MIFSKKRNENDTQLVKSILEIIDTQKQNVTILSGKKSWWVYDDYCGVIKFAVMIKNTRLVFEHYKSKCFGRINYSLMYNGQNIECDQYTLKEMFDKLLKMDVGSKESLYSLI